VLGVVQAISGFLLLTCVALSIASFVVRFRRSRGVERQQLRWYLVGAICLAIGILIGVVFNPPVNWPFAITTSAVPVTAGIAITRYHLYDLDRLISRAVAYLAVSAVLVAVYAGIVIGIGALTGRTDSPILIAGATLAVAALVRPVLRRVKSAIDRRFYRRRYDAQRALEAFSASLRDEVALEQVRGRLLGTVRETMQPTAASVWLRGGER
jgi:small-conductance mechanosensitive channel